MRLIRCAAKILSLALVLGLWNSSESWALAASPASLTFQAVQGGNNPASQSVNVSKPNRKNTNWTASDSASWVSVSPTIGSFTSSSQITVLVNTAGLAAGTYSATVTVTAYKGGSVSIPVSLTVAPTTTTSSSTSTSNTAASLTWDPVMDTSVAGYNVYVGTASGVFGPPINVGNVTSRIINNLAVGSTYYFVVTAYDTSGVESNPSNEVSKSVY
jgi:hypothetical protein